MTIRRIYLSVLFVVWAVSIGAIIAMKNSGGVEISASGSGTHFKLTNKYSNLPELERFDKSVEKGLRRYNIKGASLAVMKDNKLIYAKGFGMADEQRGIEVQPYSQFRIASMSKLITAVAIMVMVDDGEVSLSDKVFGPEGILSQKYPEYQDKRAENITVEHLLRHEGGFTTPIGDPMFKPEIVEKGLDIERPLITDDYINYSLSRRLGYAPGRSRKYSNVGYLILSEIITEISGREYYSWVRDNVLIPAGCTHTLMAENMFGDKYRDEVRYYSDTKDDVTEAYDGSGDIVPKAYGGNDVNALKGAGGWVSTSLDMLRLAMAIDGLNGNNEVKDIISAKSVGVLQTAKKGSMPIGWASVTGGVFERTGSFSGTATIMRNDPDGTTWILLSNTSSWIGFSLNNRFKSLIRSSLNQLPKMPSQRDLFDSDYIEQFDIEQSTKIDTQ